MGSSKKSGLLVAGCEPGCGKTVVLTGLAGTLREEGFQVRAVKPISFGSRKSAEAEFAFISSISHTPVDYPVRFVNASESLTAFQWAEAVRIAGSGTAPVLIELPGALTAPLRPDDRQGGWTDVCDLARDLDLPAVLVAKEGPSAMERLILNSTYLIASGLVNVIGLITVETTPAATEETGKGQAGQGETTMPELSQEERAIALRERTGVPYLGCVRFSRSISVPEVNQGNLIKTTSAGLDLLPIIKSLNLRISV